MRKEVTMASGDLRRRGYKSEYKMPLVKSASFNPNSSNWNLQMSCSAGNAHIVLTEDMVTQSGFIDSYEYLRLLIQKELKGWYIQYQSKDYYDEYGYSNVYSISEGEYMRLNFDIDPYVEIKYDNGESFEGLASYLRSNIDFNKYGYWQFSSLVNSYTNETASIEYAYSYVSGSYIFYYVTKTIKSRDQVEEIAIKDIKVNSKITYQTSSGSYDSVESQIYNLDSFLNISSHKFRLVFSAGSFW